MSNSYDNSMLSQYQKCPMSFYLQYIKQLRKKVDDDGAKEFGSAFHKFAENRLKGCKEPLVYQEPTDMPVYSRKALDLFCEAYASKYPDKEIELLECEAVNEFELGNQTFKVKCDAVIGLQGNIYGLELKTTKSISFNYFQKYFLNSQISAQTYSIKKKYGQCSGILLRAGETKCLQRKPSADYDSVFNTDAGYLCCKFTSDYINRNSDELADWAENTLLWIDTINESIEHNLFPKSTGSWGGAICSNCEYKELCKVSKGTLLDEEIKDLFYKEVDAFSYLNN